MNIEGITLLNQFVEYSCSPLIIITIIIIGGILIYIGIMLCEQQHPTGFLIVVVGLLFALIFGTMACKEKDKTLLNYPIYIHYVIQIDDDKAAWSEIAPNYIIVEEVYPNTGIYEIKQEYKEGDE